MTMRSIFGWLGVAALAVSLGCVPTGGGGGGVAITTAAWSP